MSSSLNTGLYIRMPLLQSPKHPSRLLLAANLTLSGLVLLGLAWLSRVERASDERQGETEAISETLAWKVQSLCRLFESELEKSRRDAKAIAESATYIFTNPESYRLAAQPDEYDYDPGTGLYGSVGNAGTSVAFLSTASSLSPEILREIRLSEYLNPVFRTSASLNDLYESINLYTTDSFVRSYPWFDFKHRIAAGGLRRDFQVTGFSSFAAAMPSRNPGKQTSCDFISEDLKGNVTRWVCSAPFFAGDAFRGVVTVSLDFSQLADRLFERMPERDMHALVASREGRILGMSASLKRLAPASHSAGSLALKDLELTGLPPLESTLRGMPNSASYFARRKGFFVAAGSVGNSPERVVALLPETAVSRNGPLAQAFPPWLGVGTVLGCGLLLLVNAGWILKAGRQQQDSETQLGSSLTAFSDLNLSSALGVDPPALTDMLEPAAEPESAAGLPNSAPQPDQVVSTPMEAGSEAALLAHQLAVLSSFRVGASSDANLLRLGEVLTAIFDAHAVSFFSYSAEESVLQSRSPAGSPPTAVWREGALFENIVQSRLTVFSNNVELDPREAEALSSVISHNYLVAPLVDDTKLTGAIILSDKELGFTAQDQDRIVSLQGQIARTFENLYQCEELANLNSSCRDYCLELARAVETPLDKIRGEVQTIYSRLGKLTPYYKQHCETMLFEIGKLYEMVREAREAELAGTQSHAAAESPPEA